MSSMSIFYQRNFECERGRLSIDYDQKPPARVVLAARVTAAITQHCSLETFTHLLDEINNTQTSTEMTF